MKSLLLLIDRAIETSPIWSVIFALGFITMVAGGIIYVRWYKTHSTKQDNFYFWTSMIGVAIVAISSFAIWHALSNQAHIGNPEEIEQLG